VDSSNALRSLNASWPQTIAAMHGSGRKAVLAITGGGSGAIAELLRVPGGSRLLLEALVPYDAERRRDKGPVDGTADLSTPASPAGSRVPPRFPPGTGSGR
jgi:hypothetical protein